jgi:sigma-B regulation protein RsbU (phosphoserine phosphatase)
MNAATRAKRPIPLLAASANLPGVSQCTDAEGLQNALSSGSKQILAGFSTHELAMLLPIPHKTDVLQLVAECRLLHGEKAASDVAHALGMRVQLAPETQPILQLVLAELLQNAIEHGNLGFSQIRNQGGESLDSFVAFHSGVGAALAGPLGRIPVRLSCRIQEGQLQIELEDRGLGFRVREVMSRSINSHNGTGRGLGLLYKLLGGKLAYDGGGRLVRFALPLAEAPAAQSLKMRRNIAPILAWAGSAGRAPLLERALRSAGCHNLKVCSNLRNTQETASQYELLVLDGDAPNFASLAYTLRDLQKLWPDLPVLLLANRNSSQACTLALTFGHVDVCSPDLGGSEKLALRLERLLQQRQQLQEATRLYDSQQAEIERTRIFQQDMLPRAGNLSALAQAHNVQLAASYIGCETLAGDYWTISEAGPDQLAIGVMDFTGHGLRAALNTVQLHTLLKTEWYLSDPVEIATHLNASLHQLLGPGCFAAYVYAVLNTKTGDLRYCAGGAPPMLRKSKGGALKELSCNGLPLGLAPKLTPTLRQSTLDLGETLLIVSDAITDAPHQNGQRWGQAGLATAWSKISPALHARNALQELTANFHKTVQRPVPDDLTAVVVKRP